MKQLFSFLIYCFVAGCALAQADWNNTSFVHRSGNQVLSGSNEVIRLEGFNLGGWLMWEGWIWGGGFTQEKTMYDRIETKIGTAGAENFRDSIYWNFITEKDFEIISQQCYNIVRVPFNHTILEDDDAPFVYKDSGWELLDSILSWGEQHNVYVLLDLHSAPGGQSNGFTADPDGINLWDDQLNKDRTVALWQAIAERYSDRGIVAGYDLLNEPNAPVDADLVALYEVIIDSIRSVDTNHMLFIEGNDLASDFSMFVSLPDPNMVYEFHLYTWFIGDIPAALSEYTALSTTYDVPVWCGEWGENNYTELQETIDLFRDPAYLVRGSAYWTWKKAKKEGQYPFYYGVDSTLLWNKSIKWISNPFAPAPTPTEMQTAMDEFLVKSDIYSCSFDDPLKDIVISCGWLGAPRPEVNAATLWPNPFTASFGVVLQQGYDHVEVRLYDVSGALVRSEIFVNTAEILIDRDALANGLYVYEVIANGELLATGKMIAG